MNPLTPLLFMPAAAALFWIFLYPVFARRTSSFWLMESFSICLLFYFISDGCYAMPGIPPGWLLYARLLMLLSAPCLIPILWHYINHLLYHDGHILRTSHFLWVLASVALFIAGVVLTEISNKEVVADFLLKLYREGTHIAREYRGTSLWHYYIWTSLFFRIVIGTEFLLAAIHFIKSVIQKKISFSNFRSFLFKGGSVGVPEIQLLNLILPGVFIFLKLIFLKSFLDTHIWFSVFLAIVVTVGYSLLMLGSLLGEKDRVTLIQSRHIMFYNYNPAIKNVIVEIMMEELLDEASQDSLLRFRDLLSERIHTDSVEAKDITTVKEHLQSATKGSWDDSLSAKFHALMFKEQLFLQPSLSLADVALRLHTNKTYVSKLVNNTYNLGFPELLNTLRVDYAQRYLLENPDARQEEVAKACGFLSASSFNNIFKKLTGMTPKVWIVSSGK